jgi:two-component system chemotaxis response regulator CheY
MRSRVLLVDDSPTVRNILKVYLMNQPVDFVEAEDGDRALQVMRLLPVDLVIADINMPGRDGISFCKAVREGERAAGGGKTLPIVLLTGDKTELLRSRGQEAGCSAFLLKPVKGNELSDTVASLLPKGAAAAATPAGGVGRLVPA